MDKKYYSNGKLLLTGEYAILDGAQGWAVPTKFGQYLTVGKTEDHSLRWKSFDEDGSVWFEAIYDLESLTEVASSNKETTSILAQILMEAQNMNANFLTDASGYQIETKLTFPKDWGLGTSSTLINNIAQWAKVDAYELLDRSFGGSGYDIACAQHNTSVIYSIDQGKPRTLPFEYVATFTHALFFVYLNKKQNSRQAIKAYRKLNIDRKALAGQLTQLTNKMAACELLEDFEALMTQHENMLSASMEIPTIKSTLFPDYPGAIKSLGAWGGDFILVTGHETQMNYFKAKGFKTILSFSDMVL